MRDAIGILKPYLAINNADALTALQVLEDLSTMSITVPSFLPPIEPPEQEMPVNAEIQHGTATSETIPAPPTVPVTMLAPAAPPPPPAVPFSIGGPTIAEPAPYYVASSTIDAQQPLSWMPPSETTQF